MQGIEAIVIFLVLVFVWRSVFVRLGSFGFWQLAAEQPEVAYQWMIEQPTWVVLRPSDPEVEELKESSDFEGPYRLAVPSAGGMLVIFVKSESIDASQNEFINLYGGSEENSSTPWLSFIAMLYPILAMLRIASQGAPLLLTLGYGLSNLGYLLLTAGILAGSFKFLGFKYRWPTIIAAIFAWIIGLILSNL